MVVYRNFTQFIHILIFLKGCFFVIVCIFFIVVCCLELLLNQERFLNITKFHILIIDKKERDTFVWTQDGYFPRSYHLNYNLIYIQ